MCDIVSNWIFLYVIILNISIMLFYKEVNIFNVNKVKICICRVKFNVCKSYIVFSIVYVIKF